MTVPSGTPRTSRDVLIFQAFLIAQARPRRGSRGARDRARRSTAAGQLGRSADCSGRDRATSGSVLQRIGLVALSSTGARPSSRRWRRWSMAVLWAMRSSQLENRRSACRSRERSEHLQERVLRQVLGRGLVADHARRSGCRPGARSGARSSRWPRPIRSAQPHDGTVVEGRERFRGRPCQRSRRASGTGIVPRCARPPSRRPCRRRCRATPRRSVRSCARGVRAA